MLCFNQDAGLLKNFAVVKAADVTLSLKRPQGQSQTGKLALEWANQGTCEAVSYFCR